MKSPEIVLLDKSPGAMASQVVAERKMLASELRYRRLFETAKDGILILNAVTGIVDDVNPYLIERLGLSYEEIVGKAVWNLGPFRDIVASRSKFEELQQNEYIRYDDKPLETSDGRRLDVEFISNVYLVNRVKVIQCNIRDITMRKAAERQLREQNEILSNSHEGVMIVDLNNHVSFWNPAAATLFGWSAQEALGSLLEKVLGLDDPQVLIQIRALVEHEGFWNGELSSHARDGRKLTVDCRITQVKDETGRPRALLLLLSDVTEKKLLEAKFLRVQRLEAIGTLSGGIAHDLNNILAPILMAAGLLRNKLMDADGLELVGLIETSASRGANVIRQLLTFSRGIDGERVNVQVRHIIKEITSLARATFPRNIALRDLTDKDLWLVRADATQLHQVFMNLCVNARDAMPAGGVLSIGGKNVHLSKHDMLQGENALDGPYLLLSVRDTGQGIPPQIIHRIFDPFFTTKALGQGTGLGLSTVVGIVRSHGGFITVYSELGLGSVFHVYLPAVTSGEAASIGTENDGIADGGGETILVVDDEQSILRSVRLCLEDGGYHVLTANNGREALDLFVSSGQTRISVVLTDIMMPEMDGLTLAYELSRLNSKVRVIASSGLELEAHKKDIDLDIIAEFLAKPYQPRALLAAVRRQLNRVNAR